MFLDIQCEWIVLNLDGVDGGDSVGSADIAGGAFGDADGFDFAISDRDISARSKVSEIFGSVAYCLALAINSIVFSTGTLVSRR